MATIQLYSECSYTTTNIPNRFIDEFMPEANGEFVKVYLYLLRSLENNAASCSVSAIADIFNHTEKDVIRALKYWERMHLLHLEYDVDKSIRGIYFLRPEDAGTDYGTNGQPNASMRRKMLESSVPSPLAVSTAALPETVVSAASMPEDAVAVAAVAMPETALSMVSMPEAAMAAASMPETALSAVSMPGTTISAASMPEASESVAALLRDEDVSMASSARSAVEPGIPPVAKAGNITPMPAKASRRGYTLDEIKEFRKDPNISELFFIIETYLKHPLTANDTNTVLYWYDNLHFSNELIVYLVEYCISKGHSSMRYMDKVALAWAEAGIFTVEQAKENAAIHSQAYYGVMKALGITGRNLIDSEQAFIARWTKEYGFELPLIQEACSRTIASTHQPSFEYTDSILKNWKKNQVHTLKDVQKLDETFNNAKKSAPGTTAVPSGAKHNKFNNFTQRDYDYDQLEKMLLTTSVQ